MKSDNEVEEKIAASENASLKNLAVCMNRKELAQAIEKYDVEVGLCLDMQLQPSNCLIRTRTWSLEL